MLMVVMVIIVMVGGNSSSSDSRDHNHGSDGGASRQDRLHLESRTASWARLWTLSSMPSTYGNDIPTGNPGPLDGRAYTACSQVNVASWHRQKPPGTQLKGTLPFEHLEVDFTEVKPHQHYHYLLVMVYTFSGWVEDFPTGTERASKVACACLGK